MTGDEADLAGWKIIREMVRHIWPSDNPALKARVVGAVGLLVGAKVRESVLDWMLYCDLSSISSPGSPLFSCSMFKFHSSSSMPWITSTTSRA